MYLLLRDTHRLADKIFADDFRTLGLSASQYAVLRYLEAGEAIPLSELSRRLTQGKSNLTTLIPRMERKGLVETLAHARDRRSTLIRLTDHGRQVREQVVPAHRQLLEAMVQRLTPAEQEQFLAYLARVKDSLTEVRKQTRGRGRSRTKDDEIPE